MGERRASDACADDEDVVMRVHVAFFFAGPAGSHREESGPSLCKETRGMDSREPR